MLFIKKKFYQQQYLLLFLFTLACLFIQLPSYATDKNSTPQSIIDKSLKSIVTINVSSSVGPNGADKWSGTGFIADIKNGLIITNAHVVGSGVTEYLVTFSNGQKIDAKPLYKDLWLDLGVLKIDSSLIPQDSPEIKFDNNPLKLNQKLYIIGATQGKGFSYHSGTLSDLYSISGMMPQQSYVVNLNIAGGASGSPLLNNQGKVCGLIYGCSKTYALVLHGKYVTNILKQLAEGKEPIRKHMGAIADLYSLDDAQKHRSFPSQLVKQYLAEFPDARNRILRIFSVVTGSPADGKLQMGDIIWKINGKKCGASLYALDYEMDNSKNNKIELEIYRDGKPKSITLDLYDINQNKITQMLEFGGAVFHYSTDFFSSLSSIPINSLMFRNAQNGSAFSLPAYCDGQNQDLRIMPQKIGKFDVHSIESLIQAIDALNGNRFTTFDFRNYQTYYLERMYLPKVSAHENISVDIILQESDFNPKLYTFDEKTLKWNISYPLADKTKQAATN